MKKIYLTLLIFVSFNFSNYYKAQSEIWGLNTTGGDGFGTLYSLSTGSTGISTQYNFSGSPGSNPQYTKLLQASNGKLYGMTNLGGASNLGVLFEYDTLTNAYSRKVDFTGTNGANPKGALIQAANGKLYGMTQFGGTSNLGVLFEYNTSTNTFSVLANFTGTVGSIPGSQPMGTLLQPDASITKLYGLTRFGGANDRGVLFEFDYSTNTYTSKVDFNGNTSTALGGNPFGQLVKAISASSSSTTVYGLASSGGTNNVGTLFEYDYSLNVCTKKVDLVSGVSGTGSGPQGSLILASNGRLYGTTVLGGANSGGVIFEYIISSNTYNKLTDLTNGAGTNGGSPFGELMEATNGKLYGLTRLGGATNTGVIFEYDVTIPASPVYTKKIDLSTANGSLPFGALMQVSTGKLYGVTSAGGAVGGGVIFQYNIGTNAYVKRIDLNLSTGGNPNGNLMQATNGKLYGLAAVGGTNSSLGVIFEYDRTTSTYTKKIDLSGNSGTNPGSVPFGSLIEATNLKLYGLTSAGGSSGLGTLFSYDFATNIYAKLVDFTGTGGLNQGSVPYGSLAQFTGTGTANSKLYGMTRQGGTSNQGVIFEFDPSTNVYTKKIDLSLLSANGYSAFGSLVETGNKFYGMTQLGGANALGVIFEYDPNANTYTKKIDFTGTSGLAMGSLPFGSLVQTSTVGVLYGMTRSGGANDLGVIFEYNANTNTYTKRFDMVASSGSLPLGSLILAANGKLYGVTNAGGTNSIGVLFEYDIATSTYTKKIDFASSTGNSPTYTQLLEVCTKPLTPGSISSSTNALCQAVTAIQNYSIAAVSNATSYAWTLPSGASITSSSIIANITANLSGVAAGSYTYGVAGVNVCGTGTLSVSNITINALPSVTVNSGPVCAGSVFTITPSGASTYSVQGGSFTVSPLTNATYTVVGVSSLGCVSSNTPVASVTVNSLPTIGVNSGTICSGNSFTMVPTGVITSTPSGGSLIVSPTTSTFYTIVGTDANNCVSANTATANVTVNLLPSISVNNATMCAGKSVTLTPTGAGAGATYSIGGLSGAGPFVLSPANSTVYPATATTSFGCVSSNTPNSNVTVYALPVISVNSPTICAGQNAVINPSGAGASGTYTVGAANGAGPFTVSPVSSTNYNVSGTSSLGCVSSNTPVSAVTVFSLPVISVNSGTICVGSTYTFVPGGASTYTITGPVSGTSFPVSPSTSTSYTIAGTSTAGCVSALPATANVTVFALPTLSVNSGTVCLGKSFTITPGGGVNYTVQPGNLIGTNIVVNPPANSDYTVTGVSAQGCISSVLPVSSVSVIALPVITTTSGAICFGDVFTTTVSGASSYSYVNTTTLSSLGSVTLNPIVNTTYSVFGTSPVGCVSTIPVILTVTVNALPVVTITGTNAICDGAATTLTANGAISYNWGTSTNTTLVVNPTTSTTYSVIGTDQNNCSNSASFPLTVNILPTVTVISGAICPGNCFTLTPSGASTYTFSSGSSVVCPSVTTNYSVAGTSTAGCESLLSGVATVSVVNILTVTISGNTSICAGGTVNLTANGASTYSWNTGATTNTLAVSPSSSTSYTVVGASGTCNDSANVLITVNALPNLTITSSPDKICVGEIAGISVSGATTYLWSNNLTTATISVSPSVTTVYTVTGTDVNNCSNTSTISLVVDGCVGINQYSANNWQYVLYPNPTNGEFIVEVSVESTATIVNALGQTVLKQKLNEGKNQVDLNEQAKGIYFVQLKNGNLTKIIKVVKQ